jgi:hypothetical protein
MVAVLCQQQHPELNEAAEFVIVDACMDILRVKWKKKERRELFLYLLLFLT